MDGFVSTFAVLPSFKNKKIGKTAPVCYEVRLRIITVTVMRFVTFYLQLYLPI